MKKPGNRERENSFTWAILKGAYKILKKNFNAISKLTRTQWKCSKELGQWLKQTLILFCQQGFLCYTVYIISYFHVFHNCDFIAYFKENGVTVVLREEPTAAQSFLSDLRSSKDLLFCLLLFLCFGPVHSETVILYCFYLPGTAEGESKCIYGMGQILPPLTCISKDSSMSTWRQSWSWSRTQRVVNQQKPRTVKGLHESCVWNFRCWG